MLCKSCGRFWKLRMCGKEIKVSEGKPSQSKVPEYRIMHNFCGIDSRDFQDASYFVVRDYFERAIAEVNHVEELTGHSISHLVAAFNCKSSTEHASMVPTTSQFMTRGDNNGIGYISYLFPENVHTGTANGLFWIKDDECQPFLKPMMTGFERQEEKLTLEDVGRNGVISD